MEKIIVGQLTGKKKKARCVPFLYEFNKRPTGDPAGLPHWGVCGNRHQSIYKRSRRLY